MTPQDNQVFHFGLHHRLRSRAVRLTEYDFMRPTADLSDAAVTRGPLDGPSRGDGSVGKTDLSREEREALASPAVQAQTLYTHHGEPFRPGGDLATAMVHLEQERARLHTGSGSSFCRRLAPGRRFTLEGHETDEANQAYVVTSVEHEGHAPEAARAGQQLYWNRFECAPVAVRFRPRRPKRKIHQVMETATVVGPEGQEIHTDELGRVKVQFHWDREGKRNEHSSCFIRVAQAWAGAGWGSQFIPRVGMEVLVGLLHGDIDCPVVTGCLYNATHPVPFTLPEEATKSGFRTQTTPSGEGSNELTFQDRTGIEEVYLHAQRDFTTVVENDHDLRVMGHRTTTITGTDTLRAVGGKIEEIAGNAAHLIAGSRTEEIAQTYKQQIGLDRLVTVHGRSSNVVRGNLQCSVDGDGSLRVAGSTSVVVGTEDVKAGLDVYAFGQVSLAAGEALRLVAADGLTIECGDSRIEMTKTSITLRSPELKLEGEKRATLAGAGPALRLGEEAEIVAKVVKLYSAGASLRLDDSAHLDGKEVLLNCKGDEADDVLEDGTLPEMKHVTLTLADGAFVPYSKKEYILTAGGRKYEGTTAADGKIELNLPLSAESAQVAVFLKERPTGKKVEYRVKLADVPAPNTPAGAQLRLRNLGYHWAKPSGEMDEQTRLALQAFQTDHEIKPSGELDDATTAKLTELHGS